MAQIVPVCMHCLRERRQGIWVDAPAAGYPPEVRLSHGMCPACEETYYSEDAIRAAVRRMDLGAEGGTA